MLLALTPSVLVPLPHLVLQEATDTLSLYGYSGNDTISFDLDMSNKDPNRYKYSEDVILEELKDYISGTYNQHYSAGDDAIQTLDLIEACGDG